jgi:tellurite resistance protein TerC
LILSGVALINRFHWLIYVFGAMLIFTGLKMIFEKDKQIDPEKNPLVRCFRKLMPVTETYQKDSFFVRRDGRYWATPLFLVVLVVEMTDLIFAVDSIPAVLAVSRDPFIVYTSNAFAILGLRSLYFVLKGFFELFHLLHYGLAAILLFIGSKMLLSHYAHIPVEISLAVIGGLISLSIVASLLFGAKKKPPIAIEGDGVGDFK